MKITIYELLGLIKDGKAPSNIKYDEKKYYMNLEDRYIRIEDTKIVYLSNEYDLTKCLNDEVEIIEEDKEIEDTRYMRHFEGNGKCYVESKGHKYYVPYDLLLLIDNLTKEVNKLKKEGD